MRRLRSLHERRFSTISHAPTGRQLPPERPRALHSVPSRLEVALRPLTQKPSNIIRSAPPRPRPNDDTAA
jgi:hypothetical protein